MAIAEVLNCVSPRTSDAFEVDACGTCASCRRIARSVHPDVMVLEPGDTGKIKIESVRDVIDAANYRPFEGRRRTVIIDEADVVVAQAQNALLKTLEEPPSASVFILVSSMPELLLPTVRSRCRPLRFGELSPVEVAGVLMREHAYDESAARAAAADAGGSVGRALTASSIDITEARAAARRLLQHVARASDPHGRLQAARDLTGKATGPAEREQLAVCLRALSSLVRDLGVLSTRTDAGLANADVEADLRRLTNAFDTRRSMRAFSAVDEALSALRGNANPKVVADWLVVQL
jgi:DNA polymerase-3 subunit delta'